MSEVLQERLVAEYHDALAAVSGADLAALVPHAERFGLGPDLDALVRTARPGAKVQRRFLPHHAQGDILRAALRTAKGQDVVQDIVVGLYAEELGDDVADPSLQQLADATAVVRTRIADSLVQLTLLGVVAREEVAAAHAVAVLREAFSCDLTA